MLGGRIADEYGHISGEGLKEGALYQLLEPCSSCQPPACQRPGKDQGETYYLYSSRTGLRGADCPSSAGYPYTLAPLPRAEEDQEV